MRLLLRMLGVGLSASAIDLACSSADFSSSGASGKGGSAGAHPHAGAGGSKGGGSDQGGAGEGANAGTMGGGESGAGSGTAGSSTGGTAGGGTTLCSEANDCDDRDPCTVDACLEKGVCDHAPKCGGDEPACCNGVCSQCCGPGDCDDGVECTENTCFAGVCNFVPGDCGPDAYCSTNSSDGPSGCLPVEDCNVDADCNKGDPCTKDACVKHKCTHSVCPEGGSCCPGVGCGECCGSSQCPQDDPCHPSTCSSALKCVPGDHCAGGELCCPSPDGKTASCGECCASNGCPDDGVACTDEKCKANDAGLLRCVHEPNPALCPVGQTCDPKADCSANECKDPSECTPPTACHEVACRSGQCVYGSVDCSDGQKCCAATGECRDCCENTDCKDAGARFCCKGGDCAACCQDSDCKQSTTLGQAPIPQALAGGAAMPCPGPPSCQVGQCVTPSQTCTALQKCCPGVGCVLLTSGACPLLQ
ncbi:MAG TPA: hypothetical protein VGQ57_06485 [Polyangiaceae bacterium]|nr:hypothetical protein [Polyangiaceae bacterium]